MRHVVLFALAGLTGCLAIRPGAPQGATTVGRGKIGLAFIGEGPPIQPNPDEQKSNDSSTTYRLGQLGGVVTAVSLAIGITDDTDVELSGEGAAFIPFGGSLGVRHHVGVSELFDFAIATQVGGLRGALPFETDVDADSALYESVAGVAQLRRGPVRPLLALELMAFEAADAEPDDGFDHVNGLMSSLTFGVDLPYGIAHLEPYASLSGAATDSKHVEGGVFVTGGVMLSFRPIRDTQPVPVYAPPPG
jgi:hypothetical protein